VSAEGQLAEWWLAIAPDLRRSVRRYGLPVEVQRDLVQDVAVLVVRHGAALAGKGDLRRWALARLHWLALDHLGGQGRARLRPLGGGQEPVVAGGQEGRVALAEVLDLIGRLPERQAASMRGLLEGQSAEAIARQLMVSPATIRSLQRFARQRLAQWLAEKETEA